VSVRFRPEAPEAQRERALTAPASALAPLPHRLAAAAAICFALTACGGGGSDTPSTCSPHPVSIALFGDSTQVGAYNAGALQRYLEARFGKDGFSLELRAVPGTTSQQAIDGTDGLNLPWPQSVHADIVMSNFGINDAYAPLGVTQEQFRANLRKLASVAVAVLETPSPTTADVYDTAPMAVIVREVAAEKHVALADVQAYVLSVPDWKDHLPDGIHPDAALHELIAQNITGPVLAKAVEVARCR